MGSGWVIKTFERARWDAIFGARTPAAEQKILDALLWEEEGYFDPDATELRPGRDREKVLASPRARAAVELARHLCGRGFTYVGLDASQATGLDAFAALMGAPEALGEDLNVAWHSPDFFPMKDVAELIARTGNSRSWVSQLLQFGRPGTQPAQVLVRYLPLLRTGRRFGTEAEPTRAEGAFYLILSPSEAAGLRDEVAAAVTAQVPWRREGAREAAETYLRAPLDAAVGTGRWVLMTCNF